jgi:hypothetical protein
MPIGENPPERGQAGALAPAIIGARAAGRTGPFEEVAEDREEEIETDRAQHQLAHRIEANPRVQIAVV